MTRTAADKARRRAAQTAKSAVKRPTCPTPAKRAYTDPDEAIGRAIHRSRLSGKPLRIYQCECGSQHLTSRVQPKKAAA